MGMGLIGLEHSLKGQAKKGFSDLAQQQQQRKIANENLEAAEHSEKMNAMGTGAAVGFMAGGGPVGAAIGAGVGYLASEIF